MKMNNINTIIWDWNGTLLNDLDFGISVMNVMLERRGLKTISREYYQDIFGFPVRNYYRILGFDVDNEWDVVAHEFIDAYHRDMHRVLLHDDAQRTLSFFKERGVSQNILSAMEHSVLNKNVNTLDIAHFFDFIEGIEDHYADTKIHKGEILKSKLHKDPSQVLFIGDTIHDMEVAQHFGWNYLLVANGHQSEKRLRAATANIISSLSSLPSLFA